MTPEQDQFNIDYDAYGNIKTSTLPSVSMESSSGSAGSGLVPNPVSDVVDGNVIKDESVVNSKISSVSVDKLTAGSITSKSITLAIAAGTGDSKIQAGKTDFTNTESGFILGIDDSDSDLAKFYIGDATTYLNWNGVALAIKGDFTNLESAANTGVIATSADTSRTIPDAAYTKIKEFSIGVAGSYDVYFSLNNIDDAWTTSGRIYKNGVAVGTERTVGTAGEQAFNQTISSLVRGDLIQFYGKTDKPGAPWGTVINFRLRASLIPVSTVNTD